MGEEKLQMENFKNIFEFLKKSKYWWYEIFGWRKMRKNLTNVKPNATEMSQKSQNAL